MLSDIMLAPLERVLNRGIAASTPAQKECRGLDGSHFALEFSGTPIAIHVAVTADSVRLGSEYEHDPDAVLRGSPLALAALARPGAARSGASGIEISGDPVAAQKFLTLLQHARPDWEEELSRLSGDVIAHRLGNLASGILGWGRNAAETLRKDTAEYLQEEGRDVPARAEVEDFSTRVARLKRSLSALSKRVDALDGSADQHADRAAE